MKKRNNITMKIDANWKNQSKEYLKELQLFLDKADNIKPEELKQEIIIQMLKCDAALTKHAEAEFEKYAKQEK